MNIKRVEHKYFIPKMLVEEIKYSLSKIMLEDKNNSGVSGYKITSIYYDTPFDDDLNQKLDGIIYREKYRLRVYDHSAKFGKFEIKRKLNYSIEKLSLELNEKEIRRLISSDFNPLCKHNEFEYAAHRMKYKHYTPKSIVEYDRFAFYLPVNNIRVTIDSNLSNYGFKSDFDNIQDQIPNRVQKRGYEILEVKYDGFIPKSILSILSSYPIRQSAISKYALSRIDNNTESQGDNLVIPF